MATQSTVVKSELNTAQILALFGLTDEAEFIGHVVWTEEDSAYVCTDESLFTYDTRPECALVYSTYKEAEDITFKLTKTSKIGFLFDLNNELKVLTEENIINEDKNVISQ